MRFYEFSTLKPFKVTVRLKSDRSIVNTVAWAESAHYVRRLLGELFGTQNVLNVVQAASVSETASPSQSSPIDQQAKSLQNRAKQLRQQAKLTKARKSVSKAQDKLRKATSQPANDAI